MKTIYEGMKTGRTLMLTEDSLNEGILIPKGTKFKVEGFPAKVRKNDKTDVGKSGFIRDYFCLGTTLEPIQGKIRTIRVNINRTTKAKIL